MEQDQRICPRCGQPAGEYRFCASCRSQFAGPRTEEPTHPATHALREVLRLEEALAAASKGINDRIAARSSTAAVQIEQDPAPVGDGNAGVLEIPKLQNSIEQRVVDASQPARPVARLEDVLTVAPRQPATQVAPSTPPPAPVVVDPVAAEPVAPAAPIAAERVAAESVAPPAPAAPAERKGFWFEYMPAPEPAEKTDATPELEPAAEVAPAVDVEPEPVVAVNPDATPRNHWVTVLCLLALIGLVMALTGRSPRRSS